MRFRLKVFEGVVGVSSCEFKSHSPHQKNRLIYSDGFFVFIAIIQPVAGVVRCRSEGFPNARRKRVNKATFQGGIIITE